MDQKKKTEGETKKEIEEEEEGEIEGIQFTTLIKENPHLSKDLLSFKESLIQSKEEKVDNWDIKDLGVQVSQKIIQSQTPLHTLEYLSQNLPSLYASLSKMKVNNSIKAEIEENQKFFPSGKNFLVLNGHFIDLEKFTPFNLLDLIKYEINLVENIKKTGLDQVDISKILSTSQIQDQNFRFSFYDESKIHWINNLEKDPMYMRFSEELNDIMNIGWYGPTWTRHNLFNSILICDPTTRECLDTIRDIFGMWKNGYPIRFGLVLVGKDELESLNSNSQENPTLINVGVEGSQTLENIQKPLSFKKGLASKISQVFEYIKEKRGIQDALFFLVRMNHGVRHSPILSEDVLKSEFIHAPTDKSYNDLISSNDYMDHIKNIHSEIIKKGFNDIPYILFNGKLSKTIGPQVIGAELNQEYPKVSSLVKEQILKKGDDNYLKTIIEHFKGLDSYHPQMLNYDYVKISGFNDHWIEINKEKVKKSSYIVCLNDNDQNSIKSVIELLDLISMDDESRVSILMNHVTSSPLRRVLKNIFSKDIKLVKEFLTRLSQPGFKIEDLTGNNEMDQLVKSSFSDESLDKEVIEDGEYCKNLHKSSSNSWLIINGRLLSMKDKFTKEQLSTITSQEITRMKLILEKIQDKLTSDLILTLSSLMGEDYKLKGARSIVYLDKLQKKFSFIETNPNSLSVIGIINPISLEIQKVSTVLSILNDHFGFSLQIFLNPQLTISDLPLKNWYRYVLSPEFKFDKSGKIIEPIAVFKQLPSSNILTLNMDVQETWLVGLTYSLYDLDNIKLSDVTSNTLNARYQLESIVLTGSCTSIRTNKPPRGLQLVESKSEHDTLVMANLGYFQLQTLPNILHLEIAKGRHSEIYEIVEVAKTKFYDQKITDGFQKPQGTVSVIPMISFDGPFLYLHVKKRKGKGKEKLLEETSEGIFNSISNMFSGSTKNETVNIFSVASGHMYERLSKIMILSVLKHTKSPVKFWFLKNYLSPQFKEYLPLMAKKYNFEYGLVMYKWPTWLNKQTIKMRTIWAYKVLFLDVLFPLKVNKIIFVDADQVCRTDMTELFQKDLKGAVLGMTPFCNDRKEMDGYRFWKGGYWENHLQGKPYHISALYVVDIGKLRKSYSGDTYRMLYDSLSKDPNSLSNLDQDLPNYASHQIPIFSLPQEWLWCESWCSDDTKSKAKTIDLCNNPQTKENKLDSARRIIPEWIDYDTEHQRFENEMREKGLLKFP